MDLVSCEHPVRVYNKYIDEYVWCNCNKCNTCKSRRSSRWIARLERERMCRRFTLFVTLTYDEFHLPLLHFSPDGTSIVDESRSISIPLNELSFLSSADRQFFDMRMAHSGIPYGSVEDIQKFHKRLNKWFFNNVTKSYQNFRYFTVCEYGSSTFRPHFHSIYFCDDERVATNFEKGVYACWQNGSRLDVQYVEKSANSYVAQYLNQLFDLPSFYSHSQIRPFFLCSKRPPIGGDYYNEEEFRQIFENTSVTTCVRESASSTSLVDVPLLPCVENRLFPKCRAFKQISHSLRVSLYRLAAFVPSLIHSFERFRLYVSYYIHYGNVHNYNLLDVWKYVSLISDGFSEKGINALKRLYYMSKRVVNYCLTWNCTVDYYVSQIELYWSKKELYVLRQFYSFQASLDNPEELLHCYPEFAYQSELLGVDILPLSECSSYQRICSENAFLQEKRTKSHLKNLYLDSLSERNNPLYNILLTYLYAKKCNEVAEVIT